MWDANTIDDPVVVPSTTPQSLNTQSFHDIGSAVEITPVLPVQKAEANLTKRSPEDKEETFVLYQGGYVLVVDVQRTTDRSRRLDIFSYGLTVPKNYKDFCGGDYRVIGRMPLFTHAEVFLDAVDK